MPPISSPIVTDVDAAAPWDAAGLGEILPRFNRSELDEPDGQLGWINELRAVGVTWVDGVESTYDGLRELADLIGIIQNTNYGTVWDIVAADEPITLVQSDQPLRVHSDLPYRRLPPGLQILLCETADAGGGDTLLADGYRVAAEIRELDADAWRTLTGLDRAFAYVNVGQRYIGGGPIIGLDSAGEPDVIRHAPDLVLPLADTSRQAEADRALAVFMAVASRPEMIFRIRLEPGQAIVFNNHRVMHGRGPVDLAQGGRRLLGCYSSLDELDSARRVLERLTSPTLPPETKN